jgi:hypothetical protein
VQRELGWSGLADYSGDVAVQWRIGVPPQDITEKAAIAVMAILIQDLAQGEVLEALRIGSGGDYLVRIRGRKRPIQAESSGIREDPSGGESRKRVNKKKVQVLQRSRAGFAAVTTFSHPQGGIVHNYLHYVKKTPRKRRRKKGRRR